MLGLSGVVVAALLLSACATPPSPRREPVAMPAAWSASGSAAVVEPGWWRAFGDPALQHVVEEALARNTDLRLAAARVAEARALSQAQHGAELPNVELGLGAQRARAISAATGRPSDATTTQAQFQAAYEVDLWGRVDALGRAADANLAASVYARDAAALSVASTAASGYLALRALDARLVVARDTLASREAAVTLARSREHQGYTSKLELAQAEAEYRATAQVVPQLALSLSRQEHALCVLLGRAPGPIERGLPLAEITLPPLPGTGLPSALLRRRPDIAASEEQVAASDAQLAAARAQLLPSLRLSASLGTATSSALHGDPFTLWSLGGSVLAPIFEGGRLKAQVQATASRRDQALIGYEKVVLGSMAEAEDQLAGIEGLQQQAVQVEAQRQALADALRIAGNRYREGYASYLDQLDAQRSLFSAEQASLQLRADLLSAQVGLYRALGGGWQAEAAVTAAK
ncbi:MAG TPA: efflux transporter outer membrane subunit [Burkholderiaceae bacterium]|nr:efflux transporter outer membrane subunit [Burkholderiaceae bacterium]